MTKTQAAATAPEFNAQRETLTGDIRDYLLDVQKHDNNPLPWSARGEKEQRETVERAQAYAMDMVESVVQIVAANGHQPVKGTMKSVQLKDKAIAVQLTVPFAQDVWAELGVASTVTLVTADTHQFEGERKPGGSHVRPDQGDLVAAAEESPVMDQTNAGKKAGGKPPADAGADIEPPKDPVQPVPTIIDMAERVKPLMDGGAGFEAAIASVCLELNVPIQDCEGTFLDAVEAHVKTLPDEGDEDEDNTGLSFE